MGKAAGGVLTICKTLAMADCGLDSPQHGHVPCNDARTLDRCRVLIQFAARVVYVFSDFRTFSPIF
jgi:hypothetical protein